MANICHLAHVFFINLVRKTSHLKLMVSVYEPNGRPGWTLYLGFSSMKRLGVFLSPPPGLDDIYSPGWREALGEQSVSSKNTTQCSPRSGDERTNHEATAHGASASSKKTILLISSLSFYLNCPFRSRAISHD